MRHGILITRPEPGLSETVRAVDAMGLEAVACPLLRIRRHRPRLPPAAALDAILLTSGQAVAPLAEAALADAALRHLPLVAVGDATAARARDTGFTQAVSAVGDAADLEALVRATLPSRARLLLATGDGQGTRLAQGLRRAGYRLHRRVVYGAEPVRRLPAPALAALRAGEIAACLFFSTETARNFERLCPVSLYQALGVMQALAISPAVEAALDGLPWQSVQIAAHPDAAAMLSLLRRIVSGEQSGSRQNQAGGSP